MERPINPMIDSAFKALFANDAHPHLLEHLLNAVVQPAVPIVELVYLDPTEEPDSPTGRRATVDVKVRDASGHTFQIEVQIVRHKALTERMLFTWAVTFSRQFRRGEDYPKIRPVTSIWILEDKVFDDEFAWQHVAFRNTRGVDLSTYANLYVLELAKIEDRLPDNPLETWLYFLKYARNWTALPEGVDQPILKEAMGVMEQFSQNDAQYYRYLREMLKEAEELTVANDARQTAEKLEAAEERIAQHVSELAEKDSKLAEKDAELERLTLLLQQLSNEQARTVAAVR